MRRSVILLALLGLLAGPAAAADIGNQDWRQHGEDSAERRHSPLNQINNDTVARLGLAWEQDASSRRGLEATPIVVDGVMYTTSTWSRVMALERTS
jgi:glucose dehydrogenase